MITQQHPCETCRKYIDPLADGATDKFSALDMHPFCATGSIWFLDTRPTWHCGGFEREPGDQ
jgi:hypothetical protein